jgi:lysophospholipid hydrolase
VQPNVSSSKRRIAAVPESVDEETLIQIATETFVKELGLEDDTVLRGGKVEIREVPTGTYLMKEESHKVGKRLNITFSHYEEINFMNICLLV